MMNLDVTALQAMPEIAAGTAALRPKKTCWVKTYLCEHRTCAAGWTKIVA